MSLHSVERFKTLALEAGGPGVLKRSFIRLNDGAGVFERLLGGGRYKTVLEIGTLRGVSAAFMAQFVERVITVDLADGQLERENSETGTAFDRREFWRRVGASNIDLHLVRDNAHKASVIRDLHFDFAFIDGDHSTSGVAADFNLVRKCGAVLLHDHDRTNPGGVVKFVKTLPKDEVELLDVFAFWQSRRG